MKRSFLLFCFLIAAIAAAPAVAQATLLAHESIDLVSSGGSQGSGTTASDMVYSTYQSVGRPVYPDGWGWAGGCGAVQGDLAVTNTGGYAAAANEVLSFNIGSIVSSLNSTYGAGNWTVSNVTLTFSSSNATQNNSRFGVGSGTFDIYWVANDNWAQSRGTPTDRQLNPVYASSATALQSWAGSQALLGAESFDASGNPAYLLLSYSLALGSSFVNDILSASTSSNSDLSLYLMATSDTIGMAVFTGGQMNQGATLPALSFDVVTKTSPVPVPSALLLLAPGLAGLGILRKRIFTA